MRGAKIKQQESAYKLLEYLRIHIANGGRPIHGYQVTADKLGWSSDSARTTGQVCSRLDLASFYAGLPLLALNWVRNAEGGINEQAFTGSWEKYKQEIEETAKNFVWEDKHFEMLLARLDQLPKESAITLWQGIEKREAEKAGFIRYNSHRKLG